MLRSSGFLSHGPYPRFRPGPQNRRLGCIRHKGSTQNNIYTIPRLDACTPLSRRSPSVKVISRQTLRSRLAVPSHFPPASIARSGCERMPYYGSSLSMGQRAKKGNIIGLRRHDVKKRQIPASLVTGARQPLLCRPPLHHQPTGT